MPGKIVIPGGAGFIGRGLARQLRSRGFEVTIPSRRAAPDAIAWDGERQGPWSRELDGALAVINLAGRSVNCRYGEANRREIYASRLKSTRAVGEAIAACRVPPRVWLNSSSATIYRHALDRPMDEATGETGKGFSVDVCKQWERTFFEAPVSCRRVALRTAMVFGNGAGGVYNAFRWLARLGWAGRLGGGRQYVSWIHEDDLRRAIEWLIEREDLDGVVNVAAPNPLPAAEFLESLRRSIGQPIGLPSTRWMLEVGAFVLRTETELLVKSRRVVPGRLLESGFRFQYSEWPEAARALAAVG